MNKINIIIIDSGDNIDHPYLKKDDIFFYDIENDEIIKNNVFMSDEIGHGTAVYGIIRNESDANTINIKLSNSENINEINWFLFWKGYLTVKLK